MNTRENTYIVIAAYNEGEKISVVLSELRQHEYRNIVVVDDGSTDNTYSLARAAGANVLKHLINRGQGAALRTGINYALKQGAQIIVTYDGDHQFLPTDIQPMVQPIIDQEVDITLGSRFKGESKNISLGKRFVLKLGAVVTFLFSGIYLTDSHNGFRALNAKAAREINISFDRMEHASEIIEEIATRNLRYKEVPVTVIYHEPGQHPLRSIQMGIRLIIKKVTGW